VEVAGAVVDGDLGHVTAATAAVLVGGRRAGSAVLVDGRHLLTARHVVAKRDGDFWSPAMHSVVLVFPGIPQGEFTARPLWLPQLGSTDVAVLDMGEQRPGRLPTPVSVWAGRRLPSRVSVTGFPIAERALEGVWREFSVSQPVASGEVQLRWEEGTGTLPGHSGGPVVAAASGSLVGILVQGSTQGRFDRFVPVSVIARGWPGLPRPWLFVGEDARGHVHRRAMGQRSRVRGGDMFRGRVAALHKIAEWMAAPTCPGRPLVITGQPGAGKSAVLARVALASERTRPGAGLVFHARGASNDELLDAVAAATGLATPSGLDGLLDGLASQRAGGPVAVMVDALDEAATAQECLAMAETLAELAGVVWLRVAVATRPLSSRSRYSPGSLLPTLRVRNASAGNLVDLDVDPYFDAKALRDFAGALLANEGPAGFAWATYQSDPALRDNLAGVVADRAGRNFLVAAMTSVALSESDEVLDPASPAFDSGSLPGSVGEALDKYLGSLPDKRRARTKGLLTALAFARGSGVTDRLWLRFAHSLGYTSSQQIDLDVLRDTTAADYLLQTVGDESGSAVRLFHQALVDQLLSERGRHDHRAVFDALCEDVTAGGGWAGASQYALAHAGEHAAEAGVLPDLIDDTGFLGHADLSRLVPTLVAVLPVKRPHMATVVLDAADRVFGLAADVRLGLFALTAAHLGLRDAQTTLTGSLGQGWRPLWAHSLGQPHQRLIGHSGDVNGVAVGRLGGRDMIVSAGQDGTLRVWDDRGASVGDPLTGHKNGVSAVAIGRLGGLDVIVSVGEDATVRVWDKHGASVGTPLSGHTSGANKVKQVNAVAVGRLGGRDVIVSAGEEATVQVWD
jgi:hypothetical protein